MNTLSKKSYLTCLALVLSVSNLTGCFVAVDGSGYEDDYYYDDDLSYHDSLDERYDEQIASSSEESVEESVEESFEESFEETVEETVETVETTTTGPVDSRPVPPRERLLHLEERFENPSLGGVNQVPVNQLSQWIIEWSPESRCVGLTGSASLLIQSEIDLGNQFEVEGFQHARLDGMCGHDASPVQMVTSLSDVSQARHITFFARAAETVASAELMVIWGDTIVMDEPLLDVWAEYTIDLTQVDRPHDVLLTISAMTSGVLIDHIRVD